MFHNLCALAYPLHYVFYWTGPYNILLKQSWNWCLIVFFYFIFIFCNLSFFIHLPPKFLPVSGPLTCTLVVALQCSSRAGSWLGANIVTWFDIVSGTTVTQRPTIWIVTSHFWLWAIDIIVPSGIQTWALQWLQSVVRLLGHHGRLLTSLVSKTNLISYLSITILQPIIGERSDLLLLLVGFFIVVPSVGLFLTTFSCLYFSQYYACIVIYRQSSIFFITDQKIF